ncbi:MAG: hypothetical protein JO197_03840 [Acidobacteria bacterium]|nr:hypothetical protein [Acidobacteriota bacterium]MBV9476482.1 hypothetical protein [Acidobacteriota bacterium]
MKRVWIAAAAYAAVLLALGALHYWRAPLGFDEAHFYAPAVDYFAARLPHVPLDYPMPMPPLGLLIQGSLARLGASVAMLRALTTLAAVGIVCVTAALLAERDSWRAALLVVMSGCYPPLLANAFSLKHHEIAIVLMAVAYLCAQRGRRWTAVLILAAAAIIHQAAAAMAIALALRALLRRMPREMVLYGLSLVPLAALVLYWRGAVPPAFTAAAIGRPVQGLNPRAPLGLLVMAGVWIVPLLRVPWKRALTTTAIAVPFTAVWTYATRLMDRTATINDYLAGPVATLIAASHSYAFAIAAAALLAAFGATLFTTPRNDEIDELRVWTVAAAGPVVAMSVTYELYFAPFVTIAWLILRRSIVASRSRMMVAYELLVIAAAFAFLIAKA